MADTISLCNGTSALVRSVSPDDGVALVEFHRHLADRTCFFRYLSPYPFLRTDEVRHLTCVDGVNCAALVVEVNGALVAVGCYHDLTTQDKQEWGSWLAKLSNTSTSPPNYSADWLISAE